LIFIRVPFSYLKFPLQEVLYPHTLHADRPKALKTPLQVHNL